MNENRQFDGRIAGLDGLRALSILLVVFSHVLTAYPLPEFAFLWRLDMGAAGVNVFFTISGYLITTLLLNEERRAGIISILGFYGRRFFRIVPAYLVYLITVWIFVHLGFLEIDTKSFLAAIFYLTDYVVVPWELTHTWSLSVEEQFYLLFPLALIRMQRRRLVVFLMIFPVLVIAARSLDYWGMWPVTTRHSFEGRSDAIAFGCLAAIFKQYGISRWQSLVVRGSLPISIACLLVAVSLPMGSGRQVFFMSLVGIAAALIVFYCANRQDSGLTAFLELAPLKWTGLVSYSVYLWQQLWSSPRLGFELETAFLLLVISVLVSYYLVEKPLIGIGRGLLTHVGRK